MLQEGGRWGGDGGYVADMLQARMHVTFLSHLAAANATIAEGDELEHENEESDSGYYSFNYAYFL